MKPGHWLALCIALLSAPAVAQATGMAFEGATVIDGAGGAPIPDAVLVVRDGRIAAVGPRGAVTVPEGAMRIDVRGKTIMPGLVNAHGHIRFRDAAAPPRDQMLDQLALYARYGVTTVYSLGDDGIESVKLRDELRNAPAGSGPVVSRLYVAGPSLRPADPAQARAVVRQNARRGVDITKTRLEDLPATPGGAAALFEPLVAQSHAEGLPVAVHVVAADAARAVIDAGADIIAHSIRDRDPDPELIAAMKDRNVGYIPTLTRDLAVFVYESTPAFVSDPFFAREAAYRAPLAALSTPEAQARYRSNPNAQRTKALLVQARRSLKLLSDAGVPIAMGTDSGAQAGRWQGYFEHLEMEMMVESGLTPMQVILAATRDAARVMKNDDQIGTLQPGYHADLLVLARNPLDDIRNTRSIEQVWIGGRRVE
jgi:imidazolonepropionase-like amidohydrolase